jgi:type IV secretory pathway VirB9-like protein
LEETQFDSEESLHKEITRLESQVKQQAALLAESQAPANQVSTNQVISKDPVTLAPSEVFDDQTILV